MPRIRTRSSSITTTDESGAPINVTTAWIDVSDAVAKKLSRLVEVDQETEPETDAGDEPSPEPERHIRRPRKE